MKKITPLKILNAFQHSRIQTILTNILSKQKRKTGLLIMTIAVFFITHSSLTAQCSGNVTLSTQAQVDAFSCTTFTGDLTIQGYGITNLDALSTLTSISGNFHIRNTNNSLNLNELNALTNVGGELLIRESSLSNVDGLNALTNVGSDIMIFLNNNLLNVDGLAAINSVDGSLLIANNPNLSNLNGLNALTYIGGELGIESSDNLINLNGLDVLTTIGGELSIKSNDNLLNLNGLDALTTIGGNLRIRLNPNLLNLNGLDALTSVGGFLDVFFNPNMENLDGLAALTSVGGNLNIGFNFALDDLINYCGLYTLLNGGGLAGNYALYTNGSINPTQQEIIDGGACPPPPPCAPPIVTCPGDQIVTCFEDINADPALVTAFSDCASIVAIYVKQPLISGGIPGCDGVTYTYIYKAIDDLGNVGECEQQFLIQNDAPTVTVIPGTTVECFNDIVVSESDATVTTDCAGDYTLDIISPVLDAPLCPGSQVTYTYRVKDFCNRIVEVDRVFTIQNQNGPVITSIPLNAFSECGGGPNLSEFIAEANCGGDIEYTVSDPVVSGTPGCPGSTIAYTYSAIDECGRIAQHTQFLTVQNDGPVIDCPETLQIFGCQDGATEDLIDAWIASVTASTSCGGAVTVTNNYNGNAGVCINNGFTNVNFSVVDACGRISSCIGTIVIIDTEAPIIYDSPQEVLVPCNGVTQDIFDDWLATQGGAGAIDGCWGDDISWSTNPSNPSLNCAGGPQAIVVEFIATDGCGNSASTTGIFNTKVNPATINVSGQVMREDAEAVADVEIGIDGGNAGIPDMEYTNSSGAYGLPEFDYEENLSIVPAKNDGPLNGISTHDLILLQQHILNIQPLNSPYKRIAADINRNGAISTIDLIHLRRLVLFIDTEFQENTSWRFVDADFVFPNPDNPFETAFPETYALEGTEEELVDFIAVKIGDLNLDADINEFTGDASDRDLEKLTFNIADKQLHAGEKVQVDFTAENFEQINGFQFTIDFDKTNVEILDLTKAKLAGFDNKNFSLHKLEEGVVTLSWNHATFVDLRADDIVFSMIVQAKGNIQLSEVLDISSRYTKAEAYQAAGFMNIDLVFKKEGVVATGKPELFQNAPNPFSQESVIGFILPEATAASLIVYDINGKVLKTVEGNFDAGYNQVLLSKNDFNTTGVLYYQLKTKTETLTKSMLLMN